MTIATITIWAVFVIVTVGTGVHYSRKINRRQRIRARLMAACGK